MAASAIALLHERASGTLRDIDRLATGGLREAARKRKKAVDAESVQRAIDVEGGP